MSAACISLDMSAAQAKLPSRLRSSNKHVAWVFSGGGHAAQPGVPSLPCCSDARAVQPGSSASCSSACVLCSLVRLHHAHQHACCAD
eukprot:189110-Chlamydomonas_euryale.AAC.1